MMMMSSPAYPIGVCYAATPANISAWLTLAARNFQTVKATVKVCKPYLLTEVTINNININFRNPQLRHKKKVISTLYCRISEIWLDLSTV